MFHDIKLSTFKFVLSSIRRVGGKTDFTSHISRTNLKLLSVASYQLRPGEWQSNRGSPPATTNRPTAHLLHRLSKHSCTSKPHHAKPEPVSRVRLGRGMVLTCNIKDTSLGGQPPHYRPLWECNPDQHVTLPLFYGNQWWKAESAKFNGLFVMCGILKQNGPFRRAGGDPQM